MRIGFLFFGIIFMAVGLGIGLKELLGCSLISWFWFILFGALVGMIGIVLEEVKNE